MKPTLYHATEKGKFLLASYRDELIVFYQEHLPYWSAFFEEKIKNILKLGGYPSEGQSLEDIQYWKPCILAFCKCFNENVINHIPNLLEHAMKLNPEAFAVDFHFRKLNGEDASQIITHHFKAVGLLLTFLNILGYYRQAVDNEFCGREIAKMVLGVSEKHINSKFKRYEVQVAITELLEASSKRAKRLSTLPTIKKSVQESSNPGLAEKIIDSFADESERLKDALSGRYRILFERVKSREIDRYRKEAITKNEDGKPFIVNFTDLMTPSDESCIEDIMTTTNQLENILTELYCPSILKKIYTQKIMEKGKKKLSGTERAIFDLLIENPEITNFEIAAKLRKSRTTIVKYRKSLQKKLSTC